jgi:hypothetical protein
MDAGGGSFVTLLRPVGSYLTRFDEERAVAERPRLDIDADTQVISPVGDTDSDRDSGAAGQAEAEEIRAAVAAEFNALLEQERNGFEERLAAERVLWADEEGARLAEQFHGALGECSIAVRSALECLLRPFVTHAILERSLADFMDAMRGALADRVNPVIQLYGPSDLLEIVRERLAQENISASATRMDTIDVKAIIDQTIIETRMKEWINRLRDGE